MITTIEFSQNGTIIDQHGSPVANIDELRRIVDNPVAAISNHGLQVSRQISGESQTITAWRPYQQILLDDQLVIKTGDKTDQYDIVRFWEDIYQTIIELSQQLETSLDNHTDIASYLGYYGYLGYEISRYLENYEHRDDTLPYPSLIFEFPTRFLITRSSSVLYIEVDLSAIPAPEITVPSATPTPDTITHLTAYSDYIQDLEQIIDHIKQGDIYQANYTQQFQLPLPADIVISELYQTIRTEQTLPHAAYLNFGTLQVMSLSPELFLRIEQGRVMTKPIKGTRPRGSTRQEDQQFINELVNSTKDHAELAMIVDLLRNDLGKSALPGSVDVADHAVVESYENVHHLVSTVTAEIEPTLEASWRLLLRAFPGGSISGVPKTRALEIIEHHEYVPRGIYTGNIGYLGLSGDFELNIAIRTAIITNELVRFNAGGGIVFDSDPVDEYIESLHKAKHLANYFNHSLIGHLVWYDGSFVVSDKVELSPAQPGIFETILVENGTIKRLEYHRSRFQSGCEYYNLGVDLFPSVSVLNKLLRLNVATSGLIRLNLYAWKDRNVIHTAAKVQSYSPPDGPVTLYLSDDKFSVPEPMKQGFKSLTYKPYKRATLKGKNHGAWDSLLVDQRGYLLEGGRCTVFLYTDRWLTPRHHVVKGTIRQQLLDAGVIEKANFDVENLDETRTIAIGNALIGVVPVKKIINDTGTIWEERDRKPVHDLYDIIDH